MRACISFCRRGKSGNAHFPSWKEKDFASLKKDYELLYQIIASAKGQKSFVETDAFCEVFGHPALKEGLAAAEISNIDMIPGNLLLDGEKVWVADYEWVFPFAVPIAFIYARSVFLQEAASALTKEEQEELYAIGGISMEEIPVYYHMEECFQEFAAGKGEPNALATFYGKLHRHNYPLSIWEKEKMMYRLCSPKQHRRRENSIMRTASAWMSRR